MFDIGFSELCLVALIALLVVGPKRLPETVRAWGRWTARARQAIQTLQREVEQELDLEEVRRIGQEYRRDRSPGSDQAGSDRAPRPSGSGSSHSGTIGSGTIGVPEPAADPVAPSADDPSIPDVQGTPEGPRS
ncbi:MAG: twin-arginine translocase subunit TatB [Gammaproteobacteria bacterium]|nr:twin-arginine translocase subunit TatB [Gammaproteobacteria bacterium]